jgi:hypothetical protein
MIPFLAFSCLNSGLLATSDGELCIAAAHHNVLFVPNLDQGELFDVLYKA